jgi:phage-related minor tail protein
MTRMAEAQTQLQPTLARLADATGAGALDEASRAHLRNLELYLARILEEMTQGRMQATSEIRNEIKVLARTIAALAEDPRQ